LPTPRFSENLPSLSVDVPILVPGTTTETPETGSFFSLRILPVSLIACACVNEKDPMLSKKRKNLSHWFIV